MRCNRCRVQSSSTCAEVRKYINQRVVMLRHGCCCSDRLIFRKIDEIALVLGIHRSSVQLILLRWRQKNFQVRDNRHIIRPSEKKKFRGDALKKLTGSDELNRMRSMTLKERVKDIKLRYGVQISASTLRRYYSQAGIKYKMVDLYAVHKLKKADELRAAQRNFCIEIMKLQATKIILWMDETSMNMHMKKKKTFTNGRDVFLPYQSASG